MAATVAARARQSYRGGVRQARDGGVEAVAWEECRSDRPGHETGKVGGSRPRPRTSLLLCLSSSPLISTSASSRRRLSTKKRSSRQQAAPPLQRLPLPLFGRIISLLALSTPPRSRTLTPSALDPPPRAANSAPPYCPSQGPCNATRGHHPGGVGVTAGGWRHWGWADTGPLPSNRRRLRRPRRRKRKLR